MKVRSGFVANSSSTCFIIGCVESLESTLDIEKMGVNVDGLMSRWAGEIAGIILGNSEEMNQQDLLDEFAYEGAANKDAIDAFCAANRHVYKVEFPKNLDTAQDKMALEMLDDEEFRKYLGIDLWMRYVDN